MRLNLDIAIRFGYLAVLSLIASLVPYVMYQLLLLGIAIFLFIVISLLLPKVYFEYKHPAYDFPVRFCERFLRWSRFIGKKETVNCVNTSGIALFAGLAAAFSFIPCASYQSISIGIFTSALTVALTYYVLYKHEEKKFFDSTFSLLRSGIILSNLLTKSFEEIKIVPEELAKVEADQVYYKYLAQIDGIATKAQSINDEILKWLILSSDYVDMSTFLTCVKCNVCKTSMFNDRIKRKILDAFKHYPSYRHKVLQDIYIINNQYTQNAQKQTSLGLLFRNIYATCLEIEMLKKRGALEDDSSLLAKTERFNSQVTSFIEQINDLTVINQQYVIKLDDLMEQFTLSVGMVAQMDAFRKYQNSNKSDA